jgi:pimeloyl-ACP methyl ester carboxylesterase
MCSIARISKAHQGFVRTDDGLEIFYRVLGEGEPALVCCNGVGVSTFFWEYVATHFSPARKVVVWDYRGHGRSSIPGARQRIDIPRCARDLGAVIGELQLQRPVLIGHSMGTQVALERYRQDPDNISGLVSVLGTYGHPLDTFNDMDASSVLFDLLLHASERYPRGIDAVGKLLVSLPRGFEAARLLKMVDGDRLSPHDLNQYMRHLEYMGFPFFFRFVREAGEHTAEDLLDLIDVPMLVIAGELDAFTPAHLSQKMADLVPNSRLVWLEGASHAGIVEQPELINEALESFLEELH